MNDELILRFRADITTLPGVGPKVGGLLERLIGGTTILDLIFHLPNSWIDRRNRQTISDAPFDQISTVTGVVDQVQLPFGKAPARIRLRDESGFLSLVYFRANRNWLERTFKAGAELVVSGLVQEHQGGRQMLHPDHVSVAVGGDMPPEVEPVYPLTAGLTGRQLRKYIEAALDTLPVVNEWADRHQIDQAGWPSFARALDSLHRPVDYDPDAFHRSRERLAYDEALAREIALGQARLAREKQRAPIAKPAVAVEQTIIESLRFNLTRAQRAAFSEISSDISNSIPMRRLIQGDVGSGKTVVAALAAAQMAAAGKLTVLMSPTEVLARQQAEAFSGFLKPAGFECIALTSRDKGSQRTALLNRIRAGSVPVISGTQSLYQSDVDLPDLGLIIIDEQHRFGVADRMRLASKGRSPHMLVMSATPIPRTMALALHGDMEITTIREKPVGRKEITTAALPDARIEEVIGAVRRAVAAGEKAFWICPTVDSEDAGDAAATTRHELLRDALRQPVELVHGRLTAEARDAALERFRTGDAGVLVATTVIEVGVDVPDATIIVIERADRFGLAQLHQLRGRVGRGDKPSSCLLLYKPPLTEAGKDRLDILRKTNDGFAIAEADFAHRGAGDVLGSKQSGALEFRVLDVDTQAGLIETARSDAKLLLAGDPTLQGERGQSARLLRDLLAPRLASVLNRSPEPQSSGEAGSRE